ncbi:hypothetical protein [Mycolicibacterium gadium]|jgi:hypothetical protein|uniref:Uncharacterized protein n=1 Tax=Mycolicibacterium gadium TaxID=1794 RepID=A0ABT6GSJ8_MYCGU|nr:hypothetical protein [Mycolicibacterium gadium]MDG5484264.1 hypothetical protein [Mycolicibacterium gadium]
MIDLTTIRPTFRRTPVAIPAPSAEGTTLITEQQVLFATAAAVALPSVRPTRWSVAMKSLSQAMSGLVPDSRPPAQRYRARRLAYLEDGLMSREMGRL